jgi:arsenate reductase
MGDEDKILDAIEKFPKIMQRPIIIHGNEGVIGRPPGNINKIL